jgi:hypothetical protein
VEGPGAEVFTAEAFTVASSAATVFTTKACLVGENFGMTEFGLVVSSVGIIQGITDTGLAIGPYMVPSPATDSDAGG